MARPTQGSFPSRYTSSASSSSPAKRKAATAPESSSPVKKPRQPAPGTSSDPSDKRPKRFRKAPPQAFFAIYERALSQRFFVLSRIRSGTDYCPEENLELTGSTGNIYNVHVGQTPTCTCPHAKKGNQCKHVLYVMARVLRARFELVYQLGLLKEELREVIQNAPPIEVSDCDKEDSGQHKNRKDVEGDCPICFSAMEDDDDLVFCRAQCGQNLHRECFEMWARTKRTNARDQVTCPMCRTPWQGDDKIVANIKEMGILTGEGYVNVANQLGISQRRDTSTYSPWRFRGGYGGW